MKKNKVWKLIALHVLVLGCLALLTLKYAEEIQSLKQSLRDAAFQMKLLYKSDKSLQPVETNGDEWFLSHPLIYHAGGQIDGSTYTNSLEAVENTLREGGRFIEIDFRYTSDKHLICTHYWVDAFVGVEKLTLEEFTASKIQGKFTPLTAERLIDIMRENPDMYIVTDVKEASLTRVASDLVALAQEDASVLDRVIIQLYTGREKTAIQEIYPFDDAQFLLTAYKWGGWTMEIPYICNEENISVITVPYGQMPDEDVAQMRELGFTVYEHTVNRVDEARHSLERGISGFYTDCLSPADLAF